MVHHVLATESILATQS